MAKFYKTASIKTKEFRQSASNFVSIFRQNLGSMSSLIETNLWEPEEPLEKTTIVSTLWIGFSEEVSDPSKYQNLVFDALEKAGAKITDKKAETFGFVNLTSDMVLELSWESFS